MKKAALILSAAICVVTISARAADWTDANNATYTALKSINGGGSGYIATDFKPAGTDTVKFKYKPSTVSGNECIYCSRYSGGSMKNQFCGFRIGSVFRIDSHDYYNKTYPRQYNCNTTKPLTAGTEYTLSADYYNAAVTINGTPQTLSGDMLKSSSTDYTPGSILVLLASHTSTSANAASAATLTGIGYQATGELYYFQLWSYEGALSHNFMPAKRDSDSAVGLYDTKTQMFYPATGGTLTGAAYGASERAGKKWTGLGGDNKMSTDANWENNDMPAAGDDVDFTLAAPNAAIEADIDATFGKIYLGAGDLPAFSGALASSAISDFTRMQAYDTATEGFTFTLAAPSGQNFTWNGGTAANWSTTDESWLYNNAASAWYDNNNAIFDTADATATLTVDATANSLEFNRNATVDGTATLTVPSVVVAADVSATISAPTAGVLEKTGEGTLTLGSSRADLTTVSEGTLAMSGIYTTLDWSKFTFGMDDDKPVTVRFEEGAKLSAIPNSWYVGNVSGVAATFVKDGGEWKAPQDLVVGTQPDATTTFIHKGGTLSVARYFFLGRNPSAELTTLEISGGTVSSTKTGDNMIIGVASDARVVVTNGGTFSVAGTLRFGGDSNTSGNGTLDIASGTVTVMNGLLFGNQSSWSGTGTVNLGKDGMLELGQVRFVDGSGTGNTFNFNGGTLKARSATTEFIKVSDKLMVNVSENGGTIDNNGVNISIQENFSGPGTLNLIGSGTTTFAAGVGAEGGVSVANGTTLMINGTAQSSFGSLTLAAGSTLDIANYDGTTPVSAGALALPSEGAVNLKLNGGAFGKGIYAICAAPGVTVADGDKFTFATADSQSGTWSVVDGTLLLAVGDISGNYWTGRGGDGKMSTAANWLNGVPAEGDDIDFSVISADTTIIADAARTFGAVTMGTGVITFTNAMAATSFTDTAKIAVAADSTVTLDGDLVFADSTKNKYIVYTVAEGGVFRVTGRIVLTGFTGDGHLGGSVANTCPGTIAAKGLFNDCIKNGDNQPRFVLGRSVSNYHGTWAIGSDGLDGSGGFQVSESCASVKIVAEADFVDSANICNLRSLVIDAAGHEVALGTNTLAGAGGIYGGGTSTITGGRVVANYDVDNLTKLTMNNPFTVDSGATLALMPGADLGAGAVTVGENATLEVASGVHTFDGGLTLNDGATLAFNFTERSVTPQIAVAVTVNGEVKVKIPENSKWPTSGEKVLTTCGGFNAEGVTVSLAEGAPKWAKRVDVNADGNIVLDVKPKGTRVIVR